MRILVVEREARVRTFLVHAFTAEGFAVDPAADPETAVGHAGVRGHDLAVLDLGRAPDEGLELLQTVLERRPEMPVIVLTSFDSLAIRLRAFELGASDYMTKPFSVEELLARARVHLHRSTGAATVLRAGPLTLDEQAREVHVGDRVVSLSDREFRLLRHLMTYAGQVISRERLLSAIWGYDLDPHSNVVDVCVKRLRGHLGGDAPIDTVRNAGYRLAVHAAERTPVTNGEDLPAHPRSAAGAGLRGLPPLR